MQNLRNLKIDFLRGTAILVVLFHHFHLSYHLNDSALNKIFSLNFIEKIFGNGNYGVTMFFVISGFLITTMSIQRYQSLGNINILGFYLFRFARIMPCLLLAIFLITALNLIHIHIFQNKLNTASFSLSILSVLTFWHNVLMAKVGYFNFCLNTFWSLSVEEMFYLAFPLSCLLFRKIRFILPFWIIFIILAPIYRSYYSDNEIIAVYGYFSCFDAIAMGCCAAIIARHITLSSREKTILQYTAGLLILTVFLYDGIMENITLGFSLIAIGTAILLMTATEHDIVQNNTLNPISKIICWFGKHSYELYLFHIIILAGMREIYSHQLLGNGSKLLWMAIFFALSALVSANIAKYYSQPLNERLRNIFKLS